MSNIAVVSEITNRLIFAAIGAWVYSAVTDEAACIAPERRPITHGQIFEEGLRPLGPEAQKTFVETVSRHRDAYLDADNAFPEARYQRWPTVLTHGSVRATTCPTGADGRRWPQNGGARGKRHIANWRGAASPGLDFDRQPGRSRPTTAPPSTRAQRRSVARRWF